MRNDDVRPALGMGPGEKVWWVAARWDILKSNARLAGAVTRAQVGDMAFAAWVSEISAPGVTVASGAPSTGTTGKPSGHRRGDWVGDDPVSRLFTEPFTMEMAMDTRSAYPAYNDVLRNGLSVGMLKPSGALLACRYWMACRTLLQVCLHNLNARICSCSFPIDF